MKANHPCRSVLPALLAAAIAAGGCGRQSARLETVTVERAAPEPAAAEAQASAGLEGPLWSEEVNGLEARFELKYDHVFVGTPILEPWLYLRNARHWVRSIKVPWSRKSITFKVVNARGKEIPPGKQGGMGSWTDLSPPADLTIPARGTLCFPVLGSGSGAFPDHVATVDLGLFQQWSFDQDDIPCWLHVVLDVPKSEQDRADLAELGIERWQGRIELPQVPIPTEIPQPPPGEVGRLIALWGAAMVHVRDEHGGAGYDGEAHEAARKLSLINDPRVIPWYVRAMDSRSGDLMWDALERLSRFPGDEALEGIKKGLAATAADLDDPQPERASGEAEQVRVHAVEALARSPNPKARPILFALWNDPQRRVRTEVLVALSKIDSPASTAVVKQMTHDADEEIQRSATDLLTRRKAEAAPPVGDADPLP